MTIHKLGNAGIDGTTQVVILQDQMSGQCTLIYQDGSQAEVSQDDLMQLAYHNQWWIQDVDESATLSYISSWNRQREERQRAEEERQRQNALQIAVEQPGAFDPALPRLNDLLDKLADGWVTLHPYPVQIDNEVRIGYQVVLQNPRALNRKIKRVRDRLRRR